MLEASRLALLSLNFVLLDLGYEFVRISVLLHIGFEEVFSSFLRTGLSDAYGHNS